jgi:CRISPR type III-B/RAMP module-associated protein Cmr5
MSGLLSSARTLSQLRAQHAWQQVESIQPNEIEQYADEAKKLPFQIRNAGLLQTMMFFRAKRKSVGALVSLEAWLVQRKLVGEGQLLHALRDQKTALQLRLITREALAYLEWIVRFSEAMNKEGEEREKQNGGKK